MKVFNRNKKMKRRRKSCVNVILTILGLILITLGLTLYINFDVLYDFAITSALKFDYTSEAFNAWRKNDPPLPMDVYLFNWTNPEDIRNRNIKPKFQEVGPYRFKEVKEKVNITWHHNNTISYRHRKFFYHDLDNPAGNLKDVINIINPVSLAVAYKNRFSSYFAKKTVSYSLNALSSLYVTKTVGEILFEGYDENILSIASMLPFSSIKDKFGLFYGTNGTIDYEGIYSMWTENDDKFGTLQSFNYRNVTDYYEGACGMIKGSAGEFYPINTNRDFVTLYSPELCKYARLDYEKDMEVKGVAGYKFGSKNLFDNGTVYPENRCFCPGECIPAGALNVSSCRQGSPSILSLPHFYNGDPYYVNAVEGLHPEQERHDFFMVMEPKSSIAFDVAARMQLNMYLQPIDHIDMYEGVNTVVMPIFYFDQRVRLSDELASNLRMLQKLPEIATIASVILMTLGSLCILWVFFSMLCFSYSNKKYLEEYKIPQNAHEEIPLRS